MMFDRKRKAWAPGSRSLLTAMLVWSLVFACLAPAALCRSETLFCAACGKEIQGKYMNIKGQAYHSACLTCAQCGKSLSGSFVPEGRKLYHPDCYARFKGFVCAVCGEVLTGDGVEKDGKLYHAGCYRQHIQPRCGICGEPIEGAFVNDDGTFHETCYKNHKLEKCVICSKPLDARFLQDHWGNSAHLSHKGQETEICGSCGRILSQKSSDGGFRYDDGRLVCGLCSRSAVSDLKNIAGLYDELSDLFASVGIVGVPRVPVNLVTMKELKRLSGGGYNPSAKGFTRALSLRKGDLLVSREQSVYILSGLPMIEFKGVLAHEMLHVWLNHTGGPLSSDTATEGFCNLGIMLVNQADDSDFARFLLLQLEENEDPVYGDGYRMMRKKLTTLGWKGLIQSVHASR